MKFFATLLVSTVNAAQLNDDFVPNPKHHIFEYPGVHGHLHQDNYEGLRKSVQSGRISGQSFDYYPVAYGIDYDDFYPGNNAYLPNDGKHNYNDYSYSDGDSYYSLSSDTSDSYHDSHSGDAGYLHSHGLTHDSSLNSCGSSRCDSTTENTQSRKDSIIDSDYPYYKGYHASSLASSDDLDGDLTSDLDGGDSSYGSSGVFAANPFSVTFDSSDIDSDGYLTTHSSSYSNRSSFGYGRQSDYTSDYGHSHFDYFQHDGFGGYNYGISPFVDYYGRHKQFTGPVPRFDLPSYYPNGGDGGYGTYKATPFNIASGARYRNALPRAPPSGG